ncbi:MAG: hypothetical protein M3Y67_10070 [Pseudomonadota bacterium]|nr:hypothetical protein [Pseudomonadota bacterium]
MTVFRWFIGVITALAVVGALGSFLIFMATGIDLWVGRARRFRHWTWLALLLWFNVEVWGRVILTLVNWGR